jgi:hypothetical protein
MNARWQDIVDMSDEQLAVEKAALEAEIGSGFQAKVTAEQAEAKGVATGHEASTPRRQARDATQVRRKVYVNELYCFCQQPFNRSALMVACEGCKEQFHATCLGLSRVEASVVAQFICPTCNSNKPFGSMAFKREKLLKQEISTFDELTTVDELEAVLESLIRSGERGQKLREEDLARYNEYLDAQQELVMTVAKPSTNSVSHGNSWAKNNRIHRHQRRAEHSLEKQSTKRRIAFQVDTRNLPVKKSDSDIDPDLVRRVKSHMALYGITQQMVSDCIGLSGGRSGLSNWLNTKRVPNLAAKECQLREWLRLEEDKVRAGLLTPVSPDMIGANKNKKRKASKLAH